MMKFTEKDHTFAICAYKESEYLEECIQSLLGQTKKSRIIMCTSTPNELIASLGEKYNIPIYENHGEHGIAGDWNFAYSKAETPLVTIAHQDDFYMERYVETILDKVNSAKHPLICFTQYCEYKKELERDNKMLRIKRRMLLPMKNRFGERSKFVRRRILAMGNAICCPAVTYVKENLPSPVFRTGFLSNVDWEAWEKLSRLKGEFLYSDYQGMCHRIHTESTTSELIADHGRAKEDYEMFCKFWPKWIAGLLMKFYVKSENLNQV